EAGRDPPRIAARLVRPARQENLPPPLDQHAARGHRIPVRDEAAVRAGAPRRPVFDDPPHPPPAEHAKTGLRPRRGDRSGLPRAGRPFRAAFRSDLVLHSLLATPSEEGRLPVPREIGPFEPVLKRKRWTAGMVAGVKK